MVASTFVAIEAIDDSVGRAIQPEQQPRAVGHADARQQRDVGISGDAAVDDRWRRSATAERHRALVVLDVDFDSRAGLGHLRPRRGRRSAWSSTSPRPQSPRRESGSDRSIPAGFPHRRSWPKSTAPSPDRTPSKRAPNEATTRPRSARGLSAVGRSHTYSIGEPASPDAPPAPCATACPPAPAPSTPWRDA